MRLADFILANIEPILAEWEAFARSISPGRKMGKLALRDHAGDILRATARDMMTSQSAPEQSDKSKGLGEENARLDGASEVHAVGRVASGFDLMEVVAEYRALRASVIRLWRESGPDREARDLADLTRFNESIDQSLTKAVGSYTERVEESRQMFLAILGHDLRNPLNSMMLSAALLLHTARLDAESAKVASQISASAAAMGQMIADLLDFARSGLGGEMPLSPAPMDLETLCREVIDEIRAAHPTRTVRLHAAGDLAGQWDAARLRQVISNLLGNAIQHGGQGAPVTLSLSDEGSRVQIAIHNSGPPIPPDVLPTIFDPLVRGPSADSQEHGPMRSLGLGLHIAREIVTAHGGAIDVKSSEPAGTTFNVRLPREQG